MVLQCLQTCKSSVLWSDKMLSWNVYPHSCGWVMAHCADIMQSLACRIDAQLAALVQQAQANP